MQVQFNQGIHLPQFDLWLDPHVRRPLAFVSHAHGDHLGDHDQVLATAATAAMMRLRGRHRPQFRALEFRRPYPFGDCTLTLYPAGHILGSAQLLVECAGRRLLYSGDFKLRPGRSAEPAEVPAADVVVMETTFGRPAYRFPPTEQVAEQIRAFCEATLAAGEVAVLFCYTLGKGQELLAWLDGLEDHLWLHPAHTEMAALYASLGVRLPRGREHRLGARLERGILLCPPGSRGAHWLERIPRQRTAYISGWAATAGARYRFGTDACFPLSDHADYDDLLEYARRSGARTFHTVHGFAAEFARDLRALGHDARPLDAEEVAGPQLAFEW
jgi:Cft2 family RNA processing exonuclease